jgi:hypothetical protein
MVVGLVSMITGIVLSVLSILLSAYFYTQAKKSETGTSTALGEIRQQTQSLEKLSGRLLDRLTKAVTDSSRPEYEERRLVMMFQAVREFSAAAVPHTTSPSAAGLSAAERAWILQVCSACSLYAALTNTLLQQHLPADVSQVTPYLRRLVDVTATDAYWFDGMLQANGIDIPAESRANMAEAERWKPLVRDTLGVYQERQAQGPPTDPPSEA